MITSKAYRKIHNTLRELNYNFEEFTLDDFVTHIINLRQREIVIKSFTLDYGVSGAWMPCEDIDYVFYSESAHGVLRVHVILHELGHILLKHKPRHIREFLSDEHITQLDLQLELRTTGNGLQSIEDREAELFVNELQEQVMKANRFAFLTGHLSSINDYIKFVKGLGYHE